MTIANQKTCNPVERDCLIEYLLATPVPWAADLIRRGAQLSKGEVTSREFLGSLETIFESLGGCHPKGVDGRKRFLVREVLPALQDPRCTDEGSLERVAAYMKLDASNVLEIKVTILQQGDRLIVIDGNKRASACYEGRPANAFGEISVYVICQ